MAMKLSTTRLSPIGRIALVCTAVGAVAAGTLAATLPAAAAPHSSSASQDGSGHSRHHEPEPVRAGSGYLALGDSVPFGFREPTNTPTPTYPDAGSFVGYPEDIADQFGLKTVNAACPGETSVSFIDAGAPSNGCEGAAGGSGPGYRTVFPLHVAYQGAQLRFAVQYLLRHPSTRLVSLMIGANDGFLCQQITADHCVSELPSVLARVSGNVAKILGQIRGAAHYRGQVVIVNYYSLNYSKPLENAQSQALNQAVDVSARPFHVRVADGFGVFKRAAAQAGGDSCAAGLLTTLSGGGCGVHPSVAGQQLLAASIERVIRKA